MVAPHALIRRWHYRDQDAFDVVSVNGAGPHETTKIDPELAGAHYGLAYLLLKRGDTAHAAMHLEGFLRNNTGADSTSAKFRTHAEQTLRELQNMGDPQTQRPARQDSADNQGDVQRNASEHAERVEHLKHPDQ